MTTSQTQDAFEQDALDQEAREKFNFREAENVSVKVDYLMTGYTLKAPMYDSRGVLLLSPGNVVTPRFKELLEKRREEIVHVNTDEAEDVQIDPSLLIDSEIAPFGTDVAAKLDALIANEGLTVTNSGQAMRSSVVLHGRNGYNALRREELIRNHEQTSIEVCGMMKNVLCGKKISSNEFSSLTATYLTELTNDTDQLLSIAADAGKNKQLTDHCLKMAMYGMALGVEMGYDEENVRNIGLCAMVHDWGMIKLPPHVLHPKQRLSGIAFHEYKKHPIYALEMLEHVVGLPTVIPLVCYQIHEQPNGKGYPRGKRGSMIHPFANILHVVDAYVEMLTPRPWRGPLMPAAAMEALVKLSHEQVFDSDTVRKFLTQLCLCPIGSLVRLNDASVARVLRRNGDHYTMPIVRIILDPQGKHVSTESDEDLIIDLAQSNLAIKEPIPYPGRNEQPLTSEILDDLRR